MPPTLEQAVRKTTVIESLPLGDLLGVDLTIFSEGFQHTGSFKFRAAYNLALKSPENLLITASSGNFAQGLALAAKLLNKQCQVVMPANSAQIKVENTRRYGATVHLIDTEKLSRQEKLASLKDQFPQALVVNAYDHHLIIEGNASLGQEILRLKPDLDVLIVPVGGGGLSSGIAQALAESASQTKVWGAEPLLANDAARSIKAGKLVANDSEKQTIADGARTLSLGHLNWQILKNRLGGIIEVGESEIEEGLRLLFNLANLKAEPTGALALGALLVTDRFKGLKVGVVVSGANVDQAVFLEILKKRPL